MMPRPAPILISRFQSSTSVSAAKGRSTTAIETRWPAASGARVRLDDVGAGRLTPEETQTIAAIVAKRAELFPSIELATEIDALKAQLARVLGASRAPSPIRRPFAIT